MLRKESVVASAVILLLLFGSFAIASLISKMLGLSPSLGLRVIPQIFGGALFISGLAMESWLLKYRNPSSMIVSTYFTFRKMFTRAPIGEKLGRVEPLVITGPQKFVRHPLYLGLLLIVFGWGILTNSTSNLLASMIILLWLLFVMIPFEEKEMFALFGDQYASYVRDTPMLVPLTKSKKH